ncbi:PDZ domain-containing protein, partial [bacterium]|nr:PDZ domain-containing protein [bacterium]
WRFLRESAHQTPPAGGVGWKGGDSITHGRGRRVELFRVLGSRAAAGQPGDKVTAVILREGKTRELRFRLGDRSEYLADVNRPKAVPESANFLGIEARDLNDRDRQESDNRVEQGVIITGFNENSPAAGALAPGDIIIAVGKHSVQNLSAFNDIMNNIKDGSGVILFRVFRNGRFTYVTLKL